MLDPTGVGPEPIVLGPREVEDDLAEYPELIIVARRDHDIRIFRREYLVRYDRGMRCTPPCCFLTANEVV